MATPDGSPSEPGEAVREEIRLHMAAHAREEADKLSPERVDPDPAVGPLGLQIPIPPVIARLARRLGGRPPR
jgi:hypothetical protein